MNPNSCKHIVFILTKELSTKTVDPISYARIDRSKSPYEYHSRNLLKRKLIKYIIINSHEKIRVDDLCLS